MLKGDLDLEEAGLTTLLQERLLRFFVTLRDQHNHADPVGASLLAKAFSQSTSLLTDISLSRASSLPQGLYF
ncbi:hypothetical protein PspCFBP13508_20310 [Pseudomonas sp. CFBP13508]|nr:hypothetical protein PspCFBP13508_20310 [Pseudomonas sp. CFBP13508]